MQQMMAAVETDEPAASAEESGFRQSRRLYAKSRNLETL